MERLVDKLLRDEILLLKPLHPNQHAYQAGKSVETALHQLVVRVDKALDQQEIALGVFLDIEGAFNNTSYDSMCAALAGHGVDYTIVRWIRATLEGRRAMATLGGFSRSIAVSRGCPQGGVLSPLLWCLVVNKLLARLNEGGVYSQGCVDDICLLVVGKFQNMESGLIQWDLHTVETWCGELGLSVNADKTGLVAFTRRRKLPGFFQPHFFGITLHRSMSVKYLGVILDSQLTWREHVDVKVRKAQNLLWACGRTWGLGPRVVHWLYVSLIWPSITFTSLVWWPGCQTANAKKKLSRIQRLTCLGITGAMHTTPTSAVKVLICLPPLELVVQSEVRSAAHHLWSLGCWSHLHPNRGCSSILMWLQQSDPVFSMGVDVTRPAFNLEPKYRVTMLTRENWTKGTGIPPAVKGLVWFTVVSKIGGGAWLESMGNLWEEGSAFPWVDIQQFSRPRYMLSWPVFTKFNLRIDWRNTRVSALIVMWL